MAVQSFKLADIGEGIAEVQLTEWFVKEGDMVKEMDNLCAVESDKASVELTSPFTGRVVKVHHKLQDTVKVGSVLLEIDVGGAAAPAATPAAATPAAAAAAPVAAAAPAAVQTFKLADIGEGIAEVQLTEWFVKEGDMVKEMDNLCSVESDKASVELTSPYTGKVVKVYAKLSDTVKVGAALVDIQPVGVAAAPAAAAPAVAAPAAAAPAAAPAASAGGVQQFKLADIGEGIAEVQLTEWFVKEGDKVKEMDNLCSVESDKASVELTSPYTGTIKKIHYKVSDSVKVGEVLVDIATEGASPASVAPAAAAPVAAAPTPAAAAPAAAAPAASAGEFRRAPGVLATPKVRGIAREMGIDLTTVKGTGEAGRVLATDVLAAASGATKSAPSAAASPTPAATRAPMPTSGEDQVVEITDKVGKGMIKSMNASLKQPYMALGEEIDMTELIALSKKYKEFALKKYGVKITLTSFLIKAMSLALDEIPIVNSRFGPADANPNYYTVYGSHNISIAIDSPHGLVVPNIKDCGSLSVLEIQQEVGRLAAAAKNGKLSMSDITGGTITFSNIGVIGTKDPRPILFDGQAVIGASGRTMTLPRYNEMMELEPRQIMNIRWVGDHRHLDGATLARFSNAFKRAVEEPLEWTLTLR